MVQLWSTTAAAWVKHARVEAEHPVTGHLRIGFNFPTDSTGREKATREIQQVVEKIRILREEERFDEQLDATAKGSKDKEITALVKKAEELHELLVPRSHCVIPKQNCEFLEDMRLRLVERGRISKLLHRAGVLPHYQKEFDEELNKTYRIRIEGAKPIRNFLLEQNGIKSGLQRSHREVLMTYFAHRDKEKVLMVDSILEYYNTNEDCISRGRTRFLYEKLKAKHGAAPQELLKPDPGAVPDDPTELVELTKRIQAMRTGAMSSTQNEAGNVTDSMKLPAMNVAVADPLSPSGRSPSLSPSSTRPAKSKYVTPVEIRRAALHILGIPNDDLYVPKHRPKPPKLLKGIAPQPLI